ncbi:ion transporter [Akkermansiaceae bacterium]|nr:ion transporter [Akkermansiaceae bacterium]
MDSGKKKSTRDKLWEIIFEAETRSGKWFDIILITLIIASVLVVMLETVESVAKHHFDLLYGIEWVFTILFTFEYILRLWLARKPLKYMFSFWGIVDLLAFLPTYLLLFPIGSIIGAGGIRVIRILRLLRIFRVLKMVNHVRGANVILASLRRSKHKITVFFVSVVVLSVIMGTLMYMVEKDVEGSHFTSIPISVYYAIVSLSTVGYGDITASTDFGKFVTAIMILMGYAIIAVPTGIVTAGMMQQETDDTSDACRSCGVHGHLTDAKFCRKCGDKLDD